MSKVQIGFIIFFGILILSLGTFLLKGVKTISVINSPSGEFLFEPKEEERWDFLILGVWGRNFPSGGLLTDSIIILSYEKLTGKLAIFSIPRDLWVKLPQGGWMKINAVYETGIKQKSKEKGLSLIREVITKITGLKMDAIVIVDIEGVRKIVDILGGIEIEEDRNFYVYFYEHHATIRRGKNHLNGSEVLAYIGSRAVRGADFGRMRHQQKVLLAIKNKLSSLGLIARPDRLWKIFSVVERHFETDLPPSKMISLLNLAPTLQISQIKTLVFDTSNYLYRPPHSRGYILLPRAGPTKYFEIQEVFQNIFKEEKTT